MSSSSAEHIERALEQKGEEQTSIEANEASGSNDNLPLTDALAIGSNHTGDSAALVEMRDLLVGDMLRDLQDELKCGQQILLHKLETNNEATGKRIDALHSRLQSLQDDIEKEGREREVLELATEAEQRNLESSWRAELLDMQQRLESEANAFREKVDQQSNALTKSLQGLEHKLSKTMNEQFNSFSATAVSRDTVARLLFDMAAEIAEDSED